MLVGFEPTLFLDYGKEIHLSYANWCHLLVSLLLKTGR
jgi:hypothetical protein